MRRVRGSAISTARARGTGGQMRPVGKRRLLRRSKNLPRPHAFLPVSGVDPCGFLVDVVDEVDFAVVVGRVVPAVGQRYLSVPSSRHCTVSIKVDSRDPNPLAKRRRALRVRRRRHRLPGRVCANRCNERTRRELCI